MRVLVTGATGFVGRHLIDDLLRAGHYVVAMTRRSVISADPRVETLSADLAEPTSLGAAILGRGGGTIDAVAHLAAELPRSGDTDATRLIVCNGAAVLSLLNAAQQLSVDRFVFISSIAAVGHPGGEAVTGRQRPTPCSAYGLAKAVGEMACQMARDRGQRVTTFRLSSPYGIGMSAETVLPIFVRNALEARPVTWHGEGSRSQDFVHVKDVTRACMAALERASNAELCLGSGEPTSMRDLANLVAALCEGAKAMPSGMPDPQEGVVWRLDTTELMMELELDPPRPLRDGLTEYVEAVRTGLSAPCWWWS